MTLLSLAISLAGAVAGTSADTSSLGVIMADAHNATGRVLLYLPDDMKAGDTISGSAFGQGTMTASYVSVLGVRVPVRRNMFTLTIPEAAGDQATFAIEDDNGVVNAQVAAPLKGGSNPGMFLTPKIVSAGAPVKIAGPFDGDRGNTMAEMNGRPVGVLAESPRSCVLLAPTDRLGKTRLELLENRMYNSSDLHTVSVSLRLPQRVTVGRLAKAEVVVSGLEGLSRPDYPLFVKIDGTQEVIKFDKQGDRMEVDPSKVQDGTYTGSFFFRTKKKSEFYLTARAVSGYSLEDGSIVAN